LELRYPAYFLWDDNASQNLPAYVHNWRALAGEGVLAHVNLHQYLGQVWLGNGQSGVLYPPTYLAAALATWVWGDLRPTIDLLAILHLALGAAGMAVLLRRRRVAAPIALAAALLYATFPFLAQVSRNWIFVAYVAGLAPWNLLLLLRLLHSPGTRSVLALAAVKALLFYQGHANYAVMLALLDIAFLGATFVCRVPGRATPRAVATAYAGTLLATSALAAPLLVPMLEAQRLSAYRSAPLSFAEYMSNRLELGVLVRAQLGDMVAGAIHGSSGSLFYFGLPCLLLLGVLAWPRRRKDPESRLAVAALVTAGLALALSLGGVAALYPVPVLSSFRWPFKYFFFCLLFGSLAAGLAADALWRRRSVARRVLVVALLAGGVGGNLLVLYTPRWNLPFGPYRVDQTVNATRAQLAATLPTLDQGRVLSLWQRHIDASTPRFLTHNWATLAGAYHLGGYDPLIARRNLELALGLDYSNIFRHPLDERLLGYLEGWSVRTLLAPARDDYAALLARWPQLRLHHRDAWVQVWENTAALPICSWRELPTRPVPYRWRTNGLTIDPGGSGGVLRIGLAPLRWWRVSLDGGPRQAIAVGADQQIEVVVAHGTTEVELVYVNLPFRIGVGITVAFLLVLLIVAERRNRRPPGRGIDLRGRAPATG
jgi:hypothetical protein